MDEDTDSPRGMSKIVDGLRQFVGTVAKSERELYERLGSGQSPDALFITCSDSRVSPNLITMSKPGDLFVLRNVGNLVPSFGDSSDGSAAAVEYAVDVLRVSDIIVCGHGDCGAMRALVAGGAEGLPSVSRWLENARVTRDVVKSQHGGSDVEAQLAAAIEVNVLLQLSNLRSHPPVARALDEGRLSLHAWVYEVDARDVRAFCMDESCFRSLL